MKKILAGKIEIEKCARALFEAEAPPHRVWELTFVDREPGASTPEQGEPLTEDEREEYRDRCRAKLNVGG